MRIRNPRTHWKHGAHTGRLVHYPLAFVARLNPGADGSQWLPKWIAARSAAGVELRAPVFQHFVEHLCQAQLLSAQRCRAASCFNQLVSFCFCHGVPQAQLSVSVEHRKPDRIGAHQNPAHRPANARFLTMGHLSEPPCHQIRRAVKSGAPLQPSQYVLSGAFTGMPEDGQGRYKASSDSSSSRLPLTLCTATVSTILFQARFCLVDNSSSVTIDSAEFFVFPSGAKKQNMSFGRSGLSDSDGGR